MAEDEMVGWHPRLEGHEFEKTLGNRGLPMVTAAMKLKDICSLEEKL